MMMPKMTEGTTQKERILEHLKAGDSITPIEALNKFQCFRLADVIFKLKADGHKITSTPTGKKAFSTYRLVM